MGVLEGPVKTPFGVYVFRVKKVTPGSAQSLKQSEATIKAQLIATKQQSALSNFVKKFKSKWTAKTDCLATYNGVPLASVVMDCKQYKAPKTSTTTPTPTP